MEHLVFRDGGIDPDDPAGVDLEETQVPVADGAVKGEGFPLHPVGSAAAPRDAGESRLGCEVQQQRQVGDERPRGEPVQVLHRRIVDPPRVPLVRGRRVAEAVAQHGLAGLDRR